ncbi:hypothetical protein OIU84_026182 [Salix udensis]|uniref:Uncharacterized protein n=1 Tax=Salix udensis TaxID=889485 RepID=A0AAD6KNJ9_9ROSI|nr:hypothetical protein OIU84_026182 [Salix udensis]
MKKIDMFCASQASTAICMSMDRPSSSSTVQLGGPSIDRRDPISRHQKRIPGILPFSSLYFSTTAHQPRPVSDTAQESKDHFKE